MTDNCKINDCQKRPLVTALKDLLRFCDEATVYEMQNASKYAAYIDAKALLDDVGGSRE